MKIKHLLISTTLLLASFSYGQYIYTFNDGTARNDLGTGLDGVSSNTTLTTDRFGNPNRAMALGTTGSINLGLQTYIDGNNPFTISLWLTKSSVTNNNILTKNANSTFNSSAMVNPFRVETDANQIYANRACNGSGAAYVNPSGTQYSNINSNTWFHYTYMYDGVNNLFTYINGIFYASVAGVGTNQCNNSSNWGLIVGLHPNDGTRTGLGGSVDDIHLYNTTLSGSQIMAIKNLPSEYVAKIVTQPISSCNVPANLSVSATGENLSYRWSNGSTTSSIVANIAGAYTVTVSGYGTVVSKTVVVGNISPVIATQPMATTNIKCRNPLVSISATGIDLNYLWNNGITTSSFVTTLSGPYSCTVTSATCASTSSTTLNLNLIDCIADYPFTNGVTPGFNGHYGQLDGYIIGTCANQTAVFSTSFTGVASTFNDNRTQIEWRYTSTNDINGSVILTQFADQRTITVSGSNLTVGGYFAIIKTCGNGMCSFRNSYTTAILDISTTPAVVSAPTLTDLYYVNQRVFLNGSNNLSGNPTTSSDNPVEICASNSKYPNIGTNFSGFGLKYDWKINGNIITSNSQNSVPINSPGLEGRNSTYFDGMNTVFPSMGVYSVTASNYCGSAAATYTVAGTSVASVILPFTSINTCQGVAFNFPFTVNGANNGQRSIYRNGVYIGLISSDVYTITNPSAANNGRYTMELSGLCGFSTSAGFNLTFGGIATTITSHPIAQTVCGTSATLSVIAQGSGLQYAWSNGAVSPTITSTSSNTYTVTVSGNCGTRVSTPANVVLRKPTQILTQPVSKSVCRGNSAMFEVTAVGESLTYAWNTGEVGSSITKSTSGDALVTVTGTCGSVISEIATLDISPLVTITSSPLSTTICGTSAILSVVAQGSSLQYAWSNGAITPTITATSANTYTVTVSGTCGAPQVSNAASLLFVESIAIVTQPSNANLCNTTVTTLSVSATGIGLSYLWSNGNTDRSFNTSIANTYGVTVSSSVCQSKVSSTLATISPCHFVYTFDNGNANNDLPTGYNGTVNGATLMTDRFGKANKAYNLAGTGTINLGDNPIMKGATAFTLTMWAQKPSNSEIRGFFRKGTTYMASYSNADMYAYNYNTNPSGFTSFPDFTNNVYGNIPQNDWFHLAYVLNAGTLKIYVNGSLYGVNSVVGALGNTNDNLTLGFADVSKSTTILNGGIDDVYLFDYALTDAQILTNKGNTTSTNIPTYQSTNISLSPNPSTGTFTIASTQSIGANDIKVYDLVGSSQAFTLSGNELTISKSGIYIVYILGKPIKVVVL